jgi:hypothetical protein
MPKKVDPIAAADLMRAHGLEPLEGYPGAAKNWRSKCMQCGYLSSATYAHVKSRGGGCIVCGRKRSADAKRVNPNEAAELMRSKGYEPLEMFTSGKHPWRCIHIACGSEVAPQYTNVAGGQGGCNYCGRIESARKRRLDADLVTSEIIEYGFIPLTTYPGSKNRWDCECTLCGKTFQTTLEIARSGANPLCKKCNLDRMGKKRRLDTGEASKVMKIVGLSVIGNFPGVHKSWPCICDLCGIKTELRITAARLRIAKNQDSPAQGCEKCVFLKMGKDRLLDQTEAERRLLELGMKPIGTYVGTFEPVKAVCLKCGSLNDVRLGKAYSRKRACNACSLNSRVDSSKKPEQEAIEEMLSAGFRPLDPYQNYNKPWRSMHLECGNEVSPSLSAIKRQGGCSFCAKYGFDSASPAILYVLHNHNLQATKVGITGVGTNRIDQLYKRHGWIPVMKFAFQTGGEARQIERMVLNWWRQDLGAPIAVLREQSGALGGWTETAPSSVVSAESTVYFVRDLLHASNQLNKLPV